MSLTDWWTIFSVPLVFKPDEGNVSVEEHQYIVYNPVCVNVCLSPELVMYTHVCVCGCVIQLRWPMDKCLWQLVITVRFFHFILFTSLLPLLNHTTRMHIYMQTHKHGHILLSKVVYWVHLLSVIRRSQTPLCLCGCMDFSPTDVL